MQLSTALASLIAASSHLLHNAAANHSNLFMKQSRIIGGSKANSDRYPYTVALTTGGADFFCGGSLIAPDVVLTAAHCLGGSYSVAVGRSDLTSKDGEEIKVDKEIRHPSYSWATDENDFALLLLSQPVDEQFISYNDIVRINPDESYPMPGQMSRTMGWGDTDPDDFNSKVSDELLEVDLPVISNQDCRDAEGKDNGYSDSYKDYIFDSMICTFTPGQDACQGDSGGPLIIPGSTASEDILIGVTSWGIGCATKVFPGVFARVSNAYDWIAENTCQISSNPPGYMCGETPEPTDEPTDAPTQEPTPQPSLQPTEEPTPEPTKKPTPGPTASPTPEPTPRPTKRPTPRPTKAPTTSSPTLAPSKLPTDSPTSSSPTLKPSKKPTDSPTRRPSSRPTLRPSANPTETPSASPTLTPTVSANPTTSPPTASPTITTPPVSTSAPTSKPTIRIGGNSLMIPVSALISQDKEVAKPTLAVEGQLDEIEERVNKIKNNVEDYEYNASSRMGGTLFVGVVISGIMTVFMI